MNKTGKESVNLLPFARFLLRPGGLPCFVVFSSRSAIDDSILSS